MASAYAIDKEECLKQFLQRVREGLPVEFSQTLEVIERGYDFHPAAFSIGSGAEAVANGADQNQGSCRILAFARLHQLTEAQTLALYGHYYRDEVLGNPEGCDHANIRAFMRLGWAGVRFAAEPLTPR